MKRTGIAWIPEVGEQWESYKVSHAFRAVGSGTTPDTENPAYYYGDVPWVTTGELRETVVTDTTKKVTKRALREHSALKIFPKGTLLIAMYGATIGRLGFLGTEACMNQACCALSDGTFLEARFVYYWFLGFREHVIQLGSGGGQPNISQEKVRSLRVPAPPRSIQLRIAGFLDGKTAAIDALIAKKERLIELLQEKRQALITQAVTKGLDPNVPMKDSGVPWLGEVPNHWAVLRLKQLSHRISGRLVYQPAQYFSDVGVPFVMGNNVTERGIVLDQPKFIPPEINARFAHHALRTGDVVMVRVGAPGVTAVVGPEADGLNCGSLMIVRRNPRFDSRWLAAVMNGPVVRSQIDLVQYGAAQEQINITDAVNFVVPTPPLEEQRNISEALATATHRLDTTIDRVQEQLARVREYRQALITAAVTGKLDVERAGAQPEGRVEQEAMGA